MTNTEILNPEAETAEESPLYMTQNVTAKGQRGYNVDISKASAIRLEILDREGTGQVRIFEDGCEDFIIPARYLSILTSSSKFLSDRMEEESDNLRYTYHGSLTDFGLVLCTHPEDTPVTQIHSWPTRTYLLPGGEIKHEGTPALRWTKGFNSAEKAGWELFLTGAAETVTLGFARWDDLVGLKQLIESMGEPENLMALGSLLNETLFATLSGNVMARDLRSARQLPGISMGKIKAVIASHGLDTGAIVQYTSQKAYAKLMTVKSGKVAIPIAVYLQAPYKLSSPITPAEIAEAGGNNSQGHVDIINQRLAEYSTDWVAATAAVFESEGWRVVNLPQVENPNHYSMRNRNQPGYLWVTRFDEETWGKVAATARSMAPRMTLSRATQF